jgi:hypothetical protein
MQKLMKGNEQYAVCVRVRNTGTVTEQALQDVSLSYLLTELSPS